MVENKIGRWYSNQRHKVYLYYAFMTLLTEKDERASLILKHKLNRWEQLYDISMDKVVGRIEVKMPDNTIEVAYFPYRPLTLRYFNEAYDLKEQLLSSVSRDPDRKLLEFQLLSQEFIDLMTMLDWIND
jgi:hypothetical protein